MIYFVPEMPLILDQFGTFCLQVHIRVRHQKSNAPLTRPTSSPSLTVVESRPLLHRVSNHLSPTNQNLLVLSRTYAMAFMQTH